MNSDASTIGTSDAAQVVATEYDVGTPSEVRLMNSGVNDTYAVVVGGVRYALRIYGRNRWYISVLTTTGSSLALNTFTAKGCRCQCRSPVAQVIRSASCRGQMASVTSACSPGHRVSLVIHRP